MHIYHKHVYAPQTRRTAAEKEEFLENLEEEVPSVPITETLITLARKKNSHE